MKKKDRIFIEIIVGLSLIAAAIYFFVGVPEKSIWPAGRVDVNSGVRVVMGTLAHVIAVATDSDTAKQCIEAAFTEIEKIDELMSDYRNDSEIGELNREGFKRAVKVSKSTFEVIQRSIEFSKLSGGAFDVTVGPLVDLWRAAQNANILPAYAELEEVCSRVGYDKLILDANETSVRFAADGMRVDLGGIAKGYALDKAIEAMQKAGATGAMVEIGGDVRCFGAPPRRQEKWLVGLQDPGVIKNSVSGGDILLVLDLANAAVATSGDYRRFVVIRGKTYSHVLDARTGFSSRGLASVTVISPNSTDADALATVVSIIGAEKGIALIETIPDTEAILITSAPQQKLIQTTGAEKFIE